MTQASERGRFHRRGGTVYPRLLVVVLAFFSACNDSAQVKRLSLAGGFTSASEEEAAKLNPVYERRLRLVTQLARQVKTDSLRKLYLTAFDAQGGMIDTVWNAIGCQFLRNMEQVGGPAAMRAEQHLRDSLRTTPHIAAGWSEMEMRMPDTGALQGCPLSKAVLPESLETLPFPNGVPF